MPIEIADISLTKVHKIQTLEQADFVSHRIPGLNGNVVQDMGRHAVRLHIEGIYFGENASEDLASLRDIYRAREPVDFLAEIVDSAYFSQVILEKLQVDQQAGFPHQFSFALVVAEYVPPPEPITTGLGLDGFPEVDANIGLDALDFMDMIELPDLFSIPAFQNPTQPLDEVEGQVRSMFDDFSGSAGELGGLFSGSPTSEQGDAVARSVSVDSSNSLFGQLNANVDVSDLNGVISEQENVLGGADGDLDGIIEEVLTGLSDVLEWLTNTALPQLSQPGVIEGAFADLESLIPGDTSSLTGSLSSALDDFLGDLDADFVGQLTAIVEAFEAINHLRLRFFGAEDGEIAEPAEENFTQGHSVNRSFARSTAQTNQLAEQIGQLLSLMPNPLNANSLLNWLLEGLRAIPRQQIPLGYIPVYDELRDKLETSLAWSEMDGSEIEIHLTNSVDQLAAYTQRFLIEEPFETLATEMNVVSGEIPIADMEAHLSGAISGLERIESLLSADALSGAESLIQSTYTHLEQLQQLLQRGSEQLPEARMSGLIDKLRLLENDAEARMIQYVALLSPPSELDIIRRLSQPFNELLANTGITTIGDQLRELFGILTDLLDKLNISAIQSTLGEGIDQATGAVSGLQNRLTEATLDFSLLMNEVKQFIEDVGIEDLRAAMQSSLEEVQQTLEEGADTVFEPVRNVLVTGMDGLIEALEFINLQGIIDELTSLMDTLEELLLDEDIKNQIDDLRSAIQTVNTTIGEFNITSIADAVIDVINVVKGAFELVSSIPLTGALLQDIVKEIEKNEILSPEALESKKEFLISVLRAVIEEEGGVRDVLSTIKDKPAELVDSIATFSPDQFLNENLFDPYRAFIARLEDLQPSKLVEPLEEQIELLKGEIQETLDPEQLLMPLEEPFNQLKGLLDQIDPQAIINPINEALQTGIHTITDNLPLDFTNEVFDHVQAFGNGIQEVLDTMCAFRDQLQLLNQRLAGLNDANVQVATLGDDIASRLDSVSDFRALNSAFTELEACLDRTRANPLKQIIDASLTALIQALTPLDAKSRLIALVNAHRAISPSAVAELPDTLPEKASLLNLLDAFDPLTPAFSAPLDKLNDFRTNLVERQAALSGSFVSWDARFHAADGPLSQLRASGMSLSEFQDFLKNTVREQFSEALAPTLNVVDYVQDILSAILTEFSELISEIEDRIAEFLSLTHALEVLRRALNGLIDTLNALSLDFLVDEVQAIFDEVGQQMELLRPSAIAADLTQRFEDLLGIVNLDQLFGIPLLDERYQHLLELLVDPIDGISGQLQPRFDRLLEFIQCFDFSPEIEEFLIQVDAMAGRLDTDLDRIVNAYEEMFDVIPSDIRAEANFSAG